MKKYFRAKCEQINKEVEEITSAIDHEGLRGMHAENVLATYLKEVLPKKYKIDTGLVYGISDGKVIKSRQVDIVIHDEIENPPLQVFKGFKIFPAESVYAVISVKISIDSTNLINGECNAFDNIKSIKSIPKNAYVKKSLGPGISAGGTPSETLGIVFGFKSETSAKTLAKNVAKSKNKNSPDLICILDTANIVVDPKRYELTVNAQGLDDYNACAVILNETLMIFTSLLISLLNRQTLMPIDFIKYAYLDMTEE